MIRREVVHGPPEDGSTLGRGGDGKERKNQTVDSRKIIYVQWKVIISVRLLFSFVLKIFCRKGRLILKIIRFCRFHGFFSSFFFPICLVEA